MGKYQRRSPQDKRRRHATAGLGPEVAPWSARPAPGRGFWPWVLVAFAALCLLVLAPIGCNRTPPPYGPDPYGPDPYGPNSSLLAPDTEPAAADLLPAPARFSTPSRAGHLQANAPGLERRPAFIVNQGEGYGPPNTRSRAAAASPLRDADRSDLAASGAQSAPAGFSPFFLLFSSGGRRHYWRRPLYWFRRLAGLRLVHRSTLLALEAKTTAQARLLNDAALREVQRADTMSSAAREIVRLRRRSKEPNA